MHPPPKPLLSAKLLREDGHSPITVKGGPFRVARVMAGQLVNGAGESVGLVDEKSTKTFNQLAELHRVLIEIGALAHLRHRFDNGYLDIPVEMFRSLEKLLAP